MASIASKIYLPRSLSYPALLRHLYSINELLSAEGKVINASSLSNTEYVYNSLGRPIDRIPIIHIGGTNGKGSTSWKVAKSLAGSGIRTGLFVSPHLSSFRERIQVNDEPISEDDVIVSDI